MTRQIILNLFDMAGAMHNSHGLWKHPENKRHLVYNDLNYWIELGKLLERGKFDSIFFADVAGVYDVYKSSKDPAIRDGVQVPLNDPAFVVPAMAAVTEHLSFIVTVSTTYEHPFSNARRFSTLDHFTKGRVGWNIVTSYLPNAAQNYGQKEMIKHDNRYEIADEFLEVSYKLWEGSWEDNAFIGDAENGILFDPNKVHEINHDGPFFSVKGPHLTYPSKQRTPVIFQAGASERGRDFSAKHAECVFVSGATNEKLKFYIEDIKQRAQKYGRDPKNIKTFTYLNVVVGKTTEEAELKFEQYCQLWSSEAAKAQYGGSTGYDLSKYKNEEALFEYQHTEHGQTRAASLTKDSPKKLTVKEVLNKFETIDKDHVLVGSPSEVADAIQYQFEETGIDGYNLAHFVTPGNIEDFVELVVPELQKRGIYKEDYKEGTLREKLYGEGRNLLASDHIGSNYRDVFRKQNI